MPSPRLAPLTNTAERLTAYREFLKGKRCIVVGPAGYLQGQGRGEWIDSFDVVVRLNWGQFNTPQLKEDYGSRADVLYKRLLKLGKLDTIEIQEYLDFGLQWIIAIDHNTLSGPNATAFRAMIGEAIPYIFDTATRPKLRVETRTSPLAGLIAIAGLLEHDVASVTVTGCDFYDTGYHQDYGGGAYRKSVGRREGTLGPTHDRPKHIRYMWGLRQRDKRVTYDDVLSEIVDKEGNPALRQMAGSGRPLRRQSVNPDPTPRVLGVIPARWESSRFPGKPLAEIQGKPVIVWTCEAVANALTDFVVATDDQRIAGVVQAAGYKAVMTGPALTGTDRVAQVAKQVKAVSYLNIQGDEPLVSAKAIAAVAHAKRKTPREVIGAMTHFQGGDSRDVVKVAVHPGGRLAYCSRAAGFSDWRQVGLYAYNRNELLMYARLQHRGAVEEAEDVEILRFLQLGMPVRMVDVNVPVSQAVDRPEDIERIEALLRARELVTA